MVTISDFIESSKRDKDSVIPRALKLTRSIKTSTNDIVFNQQTQDESLIPESLLKSPPNGNELNIMLAYNLAHLAWDSLTKEDFERVVEINKVLLTNGNISENYLLEVIKKILFKICDENRIKEKLNKIDKVNKNAIILVTNHLLSFCSECEPKCIVNEKLKLNLIKKKPHEILQKKITAKSRELKTSKPLLKKANTSLHKKSENTQPVTSIAVKKPTYISKKKLNKLPQKFSKVLMKKRKIKVSEDIQKNFLENRRGNSCKRVKERIDDLINEANELGLGEIKFPKSIYANERAKLALLERQIKGKIRLKIIESALSSENKLNVQNVCITK